MFDRARTTMPDIEDNAQLRTGLCNSITVHSVHGRPWGYEAMETNNKQQPHNLHIPEKILIYVVLLVLLSIAFFVTILVL